MAMDTDVTVGQLVAERPSRARVFEKLGIDYCCGGKLPLARACEERGIAADEVRRQLEDQDRRNTDTSERDWRSANLRDLCDHIEQRHHAKLKEELPRLEFLTGKIARVHGKRHPELIELYHLFQLFKSDMEAHMHKEEQILFPLCRNLETGGAADAPMSIERPVAVMVHEHEDAGRDLARIRELTHDYAVPADGCGTWRATYGGLAELEADLHQHVHKENNILFPKAIALEKTLTT